MKKWTTLALVSGCCLMAAAADAAVITSTVPVYGTRDQTGNFTLPNLLPTINGTVTDVTLAVDVTEQITQSVRLFGTPSSTVTLTPQVSLAISGLFPLGVFAKGAPLTLPVVVSGSSAQVNGSEEVTGSQSLALDRLAGLPDIFGGFAPDTDTFPLSAFGSASADLASASGTITVTYTYTPVPEPASLALLGVGVIGLGLVRRKAA